MSHFEIDGIQYTSMEQYLARSRAMMASNFMFARKALSTNDPVELKQLLYRMHDDGNQGTWLASIETWLVPGLEAKFSQNFKARSFLLATEARTIGEASYDIFWGVGLPLSNKEVFDQAKWKGENRLGNALMEVRTKLQKTV